MKYGKWLGGAVGWAFGGPIGGIFGFALGSIFDNSDEFKQGNTTQTNRRTQSRPHTTSADFKLSLLALSAAVMKADGKILKSELEVVKQFLVRNFGEDEAREQLQMLKSLLEQDIPLNDICFQIKFHMNYSQRLMLLQMLFGISAADGDLHRAEIDLIAKISYWLDISGADYDSVKTMFSGIKQNKADWYQILEIDENASDEEVKKAYRKMAMKHHPDKVSTLGPEIQQAAQEKFRKIQEAYEAIKKDRNLK